MYGLKSVASAGLTVASGEFKVDCEMCQTYSVYQYVACLEYVLKNLCESNFV